jgi:hypothetical protein
MRRWCKFGVIQRHGRDITCAMSNLFACVSPPPGHSPTGIHQRPGTMETEEGLSTEEIQIIRTFKESNPTMVTLL